MKIDWNTNTKQVVVIFFFPSFCFSLQLKLITISYKEKNSYHWIGVFLDIHLFFFFFFFFRKKIKKKTEAKEHSIKLDPQLILQNGIVVSNVKIFRLLFTQQHYQG